MTGYGGRVTQERDYRIAIPDADGVKQRVISVWAELKQSIVGKAIDLWRQSLRAFVRAKGQNFEQLIN